ncbi:MAG TPA: phosphoribosylformylglycinamidine synthase I, partial [Candidatus Marinimicrobia bacterium]|nr:phosphoribosylformylglycinamidine synthase I [Candidatus Neomarinimicrobiota bacterium]
MKIAIIQFPGSNCERESALAIKRSEMEPVEFLWNEPVDKLLECDGYFIIGGFSYEDRSRAGIIASLDPVMKIISEEAEKGKPVLGICNGAQILVETGLVPGLRGNRVGMALSDNRMVKDGHIMGTGYYNVWVNVQLTAPSNSCAFTRHLQEDEWMNIPIAHAEGRFMMDSDLLKKLHDNDQAVFKYCDEKGEIISDFPVNPNGSMDNLAAVCNSGGNILAMMPHPERTTAGDPIFSSMRDYLKEETRITATILDYEPHRFALETYWRPEKCEEIIVDLIITDNEAVSVENALRQSGIPVSVTRQNHWEI